jgi:hypothetical protein
MAELRHLLDQQSRLVLRAVQAQSGDPVSVETMTRGELYDHLAIRGRMGATEEEIVGLVQRWKDARDVTRMMAKAQQIVRTKNELSDPKTPTAKRPVLLKRLERLTA